MTVYYRIAGIFRGGKFSRPVNFWPVRGKKFRGRGILRVRTPNYGVLFRG